MSKPLLLDLFCGAGGAAMGYQRAGFEVLGVDIKPQPNYPFDFIQGDALEYLRMLANSRYGRQSCSAIHASPPCPAYANVTKWTGRQESHPRLIAPVRALLEACGLPYVIENVRTRELRHPIMLCGTRFGLPIQRHRYFETSFALPWWGEPCQHRAGDFSFDHGAKQQESVYRDAMGCDWMTVRESRQAIPPAYTEWIGKRLLELLEIPKRQNDSIIPPRRRA